MSLGAFLLRTFFQSFRARTVNANATAREDCAFSETAVPKVLWLDIWASEIIEVCSVRSDTSVSFTLLVVDHLFFFFFFSSLERLEVALTEV